jgi:hypothetical protein
MGPMILAATTLLMQVSLPDRYTSTYAGTTPHACNTHEKTHAYVNTITHTHFDEFFITHDPDNICKQVEIKSSRADVANGELRLVGLVVTQTEVQFYMDGELLR